MLTYLCPKCNNMMVCMSTLGIPPITSYKCWSCGYSSKPIREENYCQVLPEEFRQEDTEMNNDLISRSALKKAIKSYADDQYAENEYLGECAIMSIIDKTPAVPNEYMRGYEAAEREYKRPQGEWIQVVNKISECETETHWECSECHNPDYRLGEAEFCSFCGAKMGGKAVDIDGFGVNGY